MIEEAILLDATGHFDVLGTYQIQSGPGGPPRPPRYVGFAIGETLTLTVILAQNKQTFGPLHADLRSGAADRRLSDCLELLDAQPSGDTAPEP